MTFTSSLGFTPAFQINRGGADITKQFNDRVTMIRVTSANGGGNGDQLDISIDDRDWAVATPATDDEGPASLEIFMGYSQSGLYSQGQFAINTVWLEGTPKTIRLQGTSIGFSSPLKAPMITAYAGKTIQDIVSGFATLAGLEAVVDPDLGSKTINYLNQSSSGLHMLQALERTYNGLVKFGDGKLSFTKRGSGDNASGILSGGFTLSPDDFSKWSVRIANRTAHSSVKAAWFDPETQTTKFVNNGIAAQGSVDVPFLIKKIFPSQDEAQSAADSQMRSFNRGMVGGQITLAKGDPSIHGGAPFTIEGMKPEMCGSFIADRVTHTFAKQGGITTTIEFSSTGDDENFTSAIDASQLDASALGVEDPENITTPSTPVLTPSGSGGIGSA